MVFNFNRVKNSLQLFCHRVKYDTTNSQYLFELLFWAVFNKTSPLCWKEPKRNFKHISLALSSRANITLINAPSIPPQILPTHNIFIISREANRKLVCYTWCKTHAASQSRERRTFRIDTARTHIFSMKRQQTIYDLAGMCNKNLIFIFSKKEICTQNGSTFCSAHVEKKPGSSQGRSLCGLFIIFFIQRQARHKDSALCDGLDEARFLVNSPSATLWYGLNRSRLHPHYTQTE
jgi:hypothetical protein